MGDSSRFCSDLQGGNTGWGEGETTATGGASPGASTADEGTALAPLAWDAARFPPVGGAGGDFGMTKSPDSSNCMGDFGMLQAIGLLNLFHCGLFILIRRVGPIF